MVVVLLWRTFCVFGVYVITFHRSLRGITVLFGTLRSYICKHRAGSCQYKYLLSIEALPLIEHKLRGPVKTW